jgi:hypothetical protein
VPGRCSTDELPLPQADPLQDRAIEARSQAPGRLRRGASRGSSPLEPLTRRAPRETLSCSTLLRLVARRERSRMARASSLAVAAIVVGSLAFALVARADGALSRRSDGGPPAFVGACLAAPTPAVRSDCFRTNAPLAAPGTALPSIAKPARAQVPAGIAACLSSPTVRQLVDCFRATFAPSLRAGVPARVAACLAVPAGAQRASCFRGLAPLPPAIAKCLALPAAGERSSCFRALVPPRVGACLALRTAQQRFDCFRVLPRP